MAFPCPLLIISRFSWFFWFGFSILFFRFSSRFGFPPIVTSVICCTSKFTPASFSYFSFTGILYTPFSAFWSVFIVYVICFAVSDSIFCILLLLFVIPIGRSFELGSMYASMFFRSESARFLSVRFIWFFVPGLTVLGNSIFSVDSAASSVLISTGIFLRSSSVFLCSVYILSWFSPCIAFSSTFICRCILYSSSGCMVPRFHSVFSSGSTENGYCGSYLISTFSSLLFPRFDTFIHMSAYSEVCNGIGSVFISCVTR